MNGLMIQMVHAAQKGWFYLLVLIVVMGLAGCEIPWEIGPSD